MQGIQASSGQLAHSGDALPHTFREGSIASDDHPSAPRGDVLVIPEAINADVANRTQSFPLFHCAEGLCCIFNEGDAPTIANLPEMVGSAALPMKVRDQDGTGPGIDTSFRELRADSTGVSIDIDEGRNATGKDDGIHDIDDGQGRHHDALAGTNQFAKREKQSGPRHGYTDR